MKRLVFFSFILMIFLVGLVGVVSAGVTSGNADRCDYFLGPSFTLNPDYDPVGCGCGTGTYAQYIDPERETWRGPRNLRTRRLYLNAAHSTDFEYNRRAGWYDGDFCYLNHYGFPSKIRDPTDCSFEGAERITEDTLFGYGGKSGWRFPNCWYDFYNGYLFFPSHGNVVQCTSDQYIRWSELQYDRGRIEWNTDCDVSTPFCKDRRCYECVDNDYCKKKIDYFATNYRDPRWDIISNERSGDIKCGSSGKCNFCELLSSLPTPVPDPADPIVSYLGCEESTCEFDTSKSMFTKGIGSNSCLTDPNLLSIKDSVEEFERSVPNSYNFKPVYENDARFVTFYMPSTGGHVADTQIRILHSLPTYTHVKIITSSAAARDSLIGLLGPDIVARTTFIVLEASDKDNLRCWTQDYSEGESDMLVVPFDYGPGGSYFQVGTIDDFLSYSRSNHFLNKMPDTNILRVPIQFGGGNVFILKNNLHEKMVFIGSNEVINTKAIYEKACLPMDEVKFKEFVGKAFNVHSSNVIIIGDKYASGDYKPQPVLTFHIDQVMMPLSDGVMAVTSDIVSDISSTSGIQQVGNHITWLVPFLEDMGFRVVPIRTSYSHIKDHKAFTNVVMYRNKDDNIKHILMPSWDFGGVFELHNQNLYTNEGFIVEPVEDEAYKLQGNLNCVTLLASNTDSFCSTAGMFDDLFDIV